MKAKFFSVTFATANLCWSAAQPTAHKRNNSTQDVKSSFSITEVPNSDYQPSDGPSAFFKLHAKYSTKLDPRIKAAIKGNVHWSRKFASLIQSNSTDSTANSGSVQAFPSPNIDTEYVLPVQLGTPPQTLYVDLDTGSSDFWVISSDTYPPQAKGHTIYHPENSITSKFLRGQSWTVRYGDGSGANGVVYKDKMAMGGISFANQGIESAVGVSKDIGEDTFSSGLLGLAASWDCTVLPTKQLSFMENIQHQLKQPLFTANLKRQQPGTYNFGDIDHSEYIGNIQYTAIDPKMPYWHYAMSGYQVGSNSFVKRHWSAIADTGTTLLLAPDDIVKPFYKAVKGAAYDIRSAMYVIPCDANPPDFYFGVGPNYRGHIPGKYLIYSHADKTYCYGGLQSSKGIPFSVAGDMLLKAQFVVFDYGQGDNSTTRTIGFANKNLNIS